MNKYYIDEDEMYPVYSIVDEGAPYYYPVIELTDEEYSLITKARADFEIAQTILRDKCEATEEGSK